MLSPLYPEKRKVLTTRWILTNYVISSFTHRGYILTREQIAKKIRWDGIIWTAGLVNIGAMIPQLYQIIKTRSVEGLSLEMFVIYFFIQVAFSLQGFFRRDKMLMACLGLSAAVSAVIIGLVLYLR